MFKIFNEYTNKIDTNGAEIKKLRKDLNIQNRLAVIETKVEEFLKRSRR